MHISHVRLQHAPEEQKKSKKKKTGWLGNFNMQYWQKGHGSPQQLQDGAVSHWWAGDVVYDSRLGGKFPQPSGALAVIKPAFF